MEQMDANLPEFTPPSTVKTQLRSYQKQALGWLREKELLLSESAKTAQGLHNELHPLWRKYNFRDGTPFYFNVSNGALSANFPPATKQCRGGILADAMGLGKTLQALALVQTVQPGPEFLAPDDDNESNCFFLKKKGGKRRRKKKERKKKEERGRGEK